MNKIQCSSIFFRCSLTTVLLLTTVFVGWTRSEKTLAECANGTSNCANKAENSSCNSRNPYNLVADTKATRRIKISWEVCQKNDFYEVRWGDDKDDMEQIKDPAARNWTYNRAKDLVKYTFKVRGCNTPAAQDTAKEPDCTPWQEFIVTTPDW
ncbi:hypothetical protein NIES4075_65230 [Tolypothrix sp. NIES-4075]|uniref:hypothetical protein n=1 Tax=Tolypothrix sp. NIES-4075 TaxID=2005459 RepID=UPI000B5C5531|nr:hypothetical protein [Tolypothrix sp. NIES-4075]GAX45502.1 hypothetical protein NIES4075_65230 [Tolypothrix sp. NIES-4075]